MVDTLNKFEIAVLDKISNEYPFLKAHIPFLHVKSREFTGVGLFVNFSYQDDSVGHQQIPGNFVALTSNASLLVDGLKYEVAYEIAVTGGRIDFLELVANSEDWDGTVRSFWFEQYDKEV
jgi:hypothetical protein